MKKIEVNGYVIYDEDEQTFSKGGIETRFGKTPKIYKNIGHLKNHLNMHVGTRYGYLQRNYNMEGITLDYSVTISVSDTYKDRNCNVYDIKTNKIVMSVTDYFNQKISELKNKEISRYHRSPEKIIIAYEKYEQPKESVK